MTLGATEVVEFLKKLKADDRGATAVEYGLILSLIFLALMGAVEAFGQTTIDMWNGISTEMQNAGI